MHSKMSFALLAAVLLVCVIRVYEVRAQHKTYCGAMISNTLKDLCRIRSKRFLDMMMPNGMDWDVMNDPDDYDIPKEPDDTMNPPPSARYPFFIPQARAAMRQRSGRMKRIRGVHDECCKKPCSVSELMSYCKPNGGYNVMI